MMVSDEKIMNYLNLTKSVQDIEIERILKNDELKRRIAEYIFLYESQFPKTDRNGDYQNNSPFLVYQTYQEIKGWSH